MKAYLPSRAERIERLPDRHGARRSTAAQPHAEPKPKRAAQPQRKPTMGHRTQSTTLESRVAELEETVADLTERVVKLEGGGDDEARSHRARTSARRPEPPRPKYKLPPAEANALAARMGLGPKLDAVKSTPVKLILGAPREER